MFDREPASAHHAAVGKRLRLLEATTGKNGAALARELQISTKRWSDYKAARRKFPTELAGELRRLYGCSLDWLYLGDKAANHPSFTQKLRALRVLRGSAD